MTDIKISEKFERRWHVILTDEQIEQILIGWFKDQLDLNHGLSSKEQEEIDIDVRLECSGSLPIATIKGTHTRET